MRLLNSTLLQVLTVPGMGIPFSVFTRGRAVVFMLHRFADPGRGVSGHDPQALRRALGYLRRQRYELLPLVDLLRRLGGDGPPLVRAVTFTIDDGYLDHASVAAPVFAEFDCPVTTFVVTGFLDGVLWLWWDQIEFVLQHTVRRELRVAYGDEELVYVLESQDDRRRVQADFIACCKRVSDAEKRAAIAHLAQAADVELAARPPAQYAPMSWSQLQACEARGMTFGPHTVTHPVLSRASSVQSRWEIEESWRRLCAEARKPDPVFCYPNGAWEDFTAREVANLRALNLRGAVTGVPGYVDSAGFRADADAAYRILRFPFPEDLPHLIQFVSGLERAKQLLRGIG